ncbi:MAG: DUF4465 domain-containing protein [Alistipes sp.]
MKKILFFALAAFAFASCSDTNEDPIPQQPTETVDFEAAQLGTAGFLWAKALSTEQDDVDGKGQPIKSNIFYGSLYTEKQAQVYSYFTDYGHTVDVWNGFVISNHIDRKTAGYENDKSVYAEGGANGSKQFAVGYYGSWTPENKGIPVIHFASAVTPQSIAVANATYAYLYFSGIEGQISSLTLTITGYNGTTKTGDVSTILAETKNIQEGWKALDLSALGKVTSIAFSMTCADGYAPTYFCIDNLTYKK